VNSSTHQTDRNESQDAAKPGLQAASSGELPGSSRVSAPNGALADPHSRVGKPGGGGEIGAAEAAPEPETAQRAPTGSEPTQNSSPHPGRAGRRQQRRRVLSPVQGQTSREDGDTDQQSTMGAALDVSEVQEQQRAAMDPDATSGSRKSHRSAATTPQCDQGCSQWFCEKS